MNQTIAFSKKIGRNYTGTWTSPNTLLITVYNNTVEKSSSLIGHLKARFKASLTGLYGQYVPSPTLTSPTAGT